MTTLNNIPSPIRPTDADAVLGVLAAESKKHERNVNDPNQWIYVGNEGPNADQPWAPSFENGFFNVGLPLCLLRYRFLRPYDPDTSQNAVQLQGSVGGGSLGLSIFTIQQPFWKPDAAIDSPTMVAYSFDADIHLTCQDDGGSLVQVTIQASSGKVFYGFV